VISTPQPKSTSRFFARSRACPLCSIWVRLGLGPDGHTASLIPGDPVVDVTDRDVAMTGSYQGSRRMTLTYPVLNGARRALWLVTGSEKAAMLRRLRDGDDSIPAGRVCRERAQVVTDRAAAGLL
jgi:6-phosphogluconolactonase